MKAGDVCRCISNFNGLLPKELTVYKNDILQIHSVVDRHWLEAEGGGTVGRVPSSVLVKMDVPRHPEGSPLFVATADFHPAQAGDLGFARGDFIVGLNPVDDAWWCGEIYGKKGIFPINFVWKINTDIMEVVDTSEKPVNMKGRVKMSIRAQLPEELNLYAGDIVNITHIIDNDWFRGESNGETGIFPSDFVEIVETLSVSSPSTILHDASPQECFPFTDNSRSDAIIISQDVGNTMSSSDEAFTSHSGADAYEKDFSSTVSATRQAPSSEPPAALSKTSSHWKTVDAVDDADLLEDDYFKQNMPGLFSSSTSKPKVSSPTNAQLIIPPLNQASASDSFTQLKPRYENVSESFSSEHSSFNQPSITQESYTVNASVSQSLDPSNIKHRYENVNEDAVILRNVNRYENTPPINSNGFEYDHQLSALIDAHDPNSDGTLNSLSRKVEDYLSQELTSDEENKNDNDRNKLLKQFSSLSSPGYNEDNTGIEPYGRAVFSFKAQYPNELTFKKGDIIHLLKHIDSHWTLGRMGDSKGIFPTSYVDIIVNCLHNEEEMFLARAEALIQTSYLGYAKAEHTFEAVQSGDVTMVKGDILKVIKFVDDNWAIVENTNGSKGMCPRNYISILFELNSEPEKNVSDVPKPQVESSQLRESRQLIQSTSSSRSRSTSPYNISGSRRSYNKDDFGTIKQQEVESVLAKNIASLDVACKSTHSEKKESESVFTQREMSHQESQLTGSGIPPRQSRRVLDTPVTESASSSIVPQRSVVSKTKPALVPRTQNIPPVPPRLVLMKENSNDLSTSRNEMPSSTNETQCEKSKSTEPIYSKVQKHPVAGKPSTSRLQLRLTRRETNSGGAQLTRGDSAASSASFPDDVSTVSSEGTYSSETQNAGGTSPGILPQRPAPPPPPKICESEEYYSLPPEDENVISPRKQPLSQKDSATSMASTSYNVEDSQTQSNSGGDEGRYEVVEELTSEDQPGNSKPSGRVNMRRELMQEIVTTEHEYIHDLEALVQVIRLAPSQKESQSVDLDTLMGNISRVVSIAKKLLSHLDSVAYESDENLLIGRVFLLCASDICDVYKTYCSNHNVAVEPLLKKYAEEPEPAAFLQWVLNELQQHKIQLMDMRSVLIKPVQRVLKYPLFLDRLVSETSPSHADYQDLTEAKTKMANVAKEINEYTKRLDLINKYRGAVDQSLQSKMQRVSMHSVAKKSARLSAIVSEKLGIMTTTKDPDFDEMETKFRSVMKAAVALVQNATLVLQAVKARHRSELEIAKGMVAILIEGAKSPAIEAVHRTTYDSCNRLLAMFESFINKRISQPSNQLVSLCEVPERLISKRYHKLLDFDNAQYKLDRNKDPTRTRILEEELLHAKGTYEALNTQLMMELPVLIKAGTEILSLSIRSLVASRMYLQGHLAKLYLQLAQIPGLLDSGEEEMLAQFRVKYLQQVGEFRQLSFIPTESLQRSLPRAKPRGKKSTDNTVVKKDGHETSKTKVLGKYPGELIYVVSEVHTPGEVMELTLYPGDHVALLKNKDPLGKSDRWFVDDGDNKGFVRSSCLKPLHGTDNRGATATALPSSISTAVPLPNAANPSNAPRPSTLPRVAPTPPLPERPPRYEDLFPTVTTAAPRPPHVIGYQANARQAPPPRYSMGQEINVLPAQTPLPCKPGHNQLSTTHRANMQISESDNYSPPLDRQQSNEYNSPISEESNIYEEIGQARGGSPEKNGTDVTDGSPIYEVIEESGQQTNPQSSAATFPEPEFEEPQFYYALYNFGGSDCTQLNLTAGQVVLIIQAKSPEWWFVEDRNGNQGYVPASYLTKYS